MTLSLRHIHAVQTKGLDLVDDDFPTSMAISGWRKRWTRDHLDKYLPGLGGGFWCFAQIKILGGPFVVFDQNSSHLSRHHVVFAVSKLA